MTVLELTTQVRQRGFPSKSKALHKLVGKNVYMLAAKKVLQRSTDQSGYVVPPTSAGKLAAKPNFKGTALKPKTKPAQRTPLHVVLTQILEKKSTPMTGSKLAQEALEAGYQTSSKSFVQSVWTALGIMKNVENLKGQGYRLKRGK
jgi:hypothetical protein